MIQSKFLKCLGLSALLLFCAMTARSQGYSPKVDRIWSGDYDSFTSLIRYKGNYYVTFREGGGHIWDKNGIAAGKIRILKSRDGESWESVALFSEEGHDLRDPKLSITPDNRLMVSMGGSVYHGKSLDARHPYVSFSRNGKKYTAPQRNILSPDLDQENSWIWRITWHDGVGYGVDYTDHEATLVKTEDGVHVSKVVTFDLPGFPNESTVRFLPDGRMSVIVREDDNKHHSFWGVSEAPYTSWTWTEMPFYIGGPDYVIDGDRIILSGRSLNPARTAILVGDFKGNFHEALSLPSGDDNSYPGLIIVGDELWVSYYSKHETPMASIYFTKIPLKELK